MSEQEPTFKGRAFFKGSDTSYGIFYPTNYIIAIFDSYETAQRAEQTLRSAGYGDDEVDAVPCKYVIEDIEKGTKETSWLNRVKQKVSKAVGTEARYWEEDLKLAREGAGFLAVYCPTDPEAQRVVRVLKPLNPRQMRRYMKLAIERLV